MTKIEEKEYRYHIGTAEKKIIFLFDQKYKFTHP